MITRNTVRKAYIPKLVSELGVDEIEAFTLIEVALATVDTLEGTDDLAIFHGCVTNFALYSELLATNREPEHAAAISELLAAGDE